ncbi:Phosphoribosyl 1,2-cyclic phosphate phosphodiesterase [Sphingomonas antarctica]|uniref:MBL fold metallo-hydrolase n=1 Tax=Sphingomonas antarctica TaxID=2040274 RepID=UPI0039EB0CDC
MKVTILGCGTSSGVPRIGNDWGACDPADPRNRRTRASILIEHDGTRILIDTSPDLRAQLLAANVVKLDAVIWTHEHADHCHGIDDLRQVFHAAGRPVPSFARADTLASLQRRFAYVFAGNGGYPPTVEAHELTDTLQIGAIAVSVVDQPHGRITSAGLRFEGGGRAVAYSTDTDRLSDAMASLYTDLDLWIVDGLREKPHPSHAHVAETLGWIAQLQPKRAVITHMDQSLDYATLAARLPAGVEPGHDNLEIEL